MHTDFHRLKAGDFVAGPPHISSVLICVNLWRRAFDEINSNQRAQSRLATDVVVSEVEAMHTHLPR